MDDFKKELEEAAIVYIKNLVKDYRKNGLTAMNIDSELSKEIYKAGVEQFCKKKDERIKELNAMNWKEINANTELVAENVSLKRAIENRTNIVCTCNLIKRCELENSVCAKCMIVDLEKKLAVAEGRIKGLERVIANALLKELGWK